MIFIFFLLFKITIFNKKILNRQKREVNHDREANHDMHKYFWKFFIVFKSIFQKYFKKIFFYFTLIL